MPRNQDRVDVMFSEEGDYVLDNFGDLADTSSDPLLSFRQEVTWRVKAQFGEWALHPEDSANLDDLKGEPNTRLTAEKGTQLITQALTYDGFLKEEDLDIRPVPINNSTLVYFLTTAISPTFENGQTSTVKFQVLFDYDNNGVTFA